MWENCSDLSLHTHTQKKIDGTRNIKHWGNIGQQWILVSTYIIRGDNWWEILGHEWKETHIERTEWIDKQHKSTKEQSSWGIYISHSIDMVQSISFEWINEETLQ